MKTTLMTLLIAALAAGAAFAQEDGMNAPPRKGKAWEREAGGRPGDPMARRGGPEQAGGMMSAELRAQMKADHEAIRDLAGAYRLETDEARKAEYAAQIRTKLGEIADRMQTAQAERLAQAEERLAALKAKIAENQANRDARIEEQLKQILSGERPQRPDRFKEFPHAKGGRGGPGGQMPPPPPGGEMPEDMPPPEE